ncbi:hypothetical protein [Adhaeribacter soli]|uniref:Uncharacterized protein n=1 Tax=Adhaeribacter soli TaxID=2607655 RepID=A0A5N1ISQ9_9BACT|nr:hypothetical protein [Adhaeribacter soli]KAA9332698.1 hypothetical protein F0P94_11865 [Adhaeribacter soli]
MEYISANQINVLVYNLLSKDVSHLLLYENEEAFSSLMQAGLKTTRKGSDLMLYIKSEHELYKVRRITQYPLFIKF